MDIRGEAGDAHVIDVIEPHVQVLGNVMVGSPGDESQLVVAVVDGHGIGIEGVVLFTDKIQLGPDLEHLEGLAAFPVTESGDVEVRQMDLFDRFAFFASHKATVFEIKLSVLLSESKVKARLHQNVGQPRGMMKYLRFLLQSQQIKQMVMPEIFDLPGNLRIDHHSRLAL